MNMKTASRILLTLGVSFILVACGGGGGGGGGNDSPASSTQQSSPPGPPPAQNGGQPTHPIPNDPTVPTPVPTPPPAPFSHDVHLSWTPPSERENGEPLLPSDIQGYEIYYLHESEGNSPGSGQVQMVDGGSVTSAVVTVTATGTYYFAIAAVDQEGLKSELSNDVSITVN